MSKSKKPTWTKHPALPIPDIAMIEAKGWDKNVQGMLDYHADREDMIFKMNDDPYRYGHELDHWLKADELLKQGSELMCLGGNRCISPDSMIYDPRAGKHRKVSDIKSSFYVRSWDGNKMVDARAYKPFIKGFEMMYRVELSNGENLDCTQNHRLLTQQGYKQLNELDVGDSLLCASSYARNDFYTTVDSQVDYQAYHGLCGEQPLHSQGISQSPSPSQGGVHTLAHEMMHSDGNEPRQPDNHSLCHSPFYHKSLYCADGITAQYKPDAYQNMPRYSPECVHFEPCSEFYQVHHQSIDETHDSSLFDDSSLQDLSSSSDNSASLKSHELSYLAQPAHGQNLDLPYSSERCLTIKRIVSTRKQDVWDFHVPVYNNYELAGAISHNSGKTEWAGKRLVHAAMNNPNSILWAFQTTFENSVQMQQKVIWKYIPKELKNAKKTKVTNISYSQKRGFSDGKVVFPNGSEIVFRNYSQDITTIEGGEIGSMNPMEGEPHIHNIGFWADELIPQAWLETLRFRLVTRDAVGIITFTPIEGYSPTVKEYLNGAITEEEIVSDLIPKMKVPIVQQPKRKDSKIIYFQTKDNIYGGYERIKKTLEGAHRDDILCRAHGVPVKPMAGKFPKFSHKHNVVKHSEIPFIKDKEADVTHYMVIDPSGAKPWFMIWISVTPLDEVYVWAEFPDYSYGDWADMSKGTKGRPGDAAKPNGYGFQDYKDRMLEIEDGRVIFERIIDPRLGATRFQKEECQTTYIDELTNIGIDTIPAPGYDEDTGLQAINNWLSWDDTKPMDLGNKPKLFISDQCENTIYSFTEYTGMLGKDEPTKDAIDCVRYAAVSEIIYIDHSQTHYIRDVRH